MRTAYHSYSEDVFDLATKYITNNDFGYDRAMCGCRDIARNYARPWERVAEDFEIACDEVVEVGLTFSL